MDRVGKANTSSSAAATGMSVKHLVPPTQPVRGRLGTVFATPNRHWILLTCYFPHHLYLKMLWQKIDTVGYRLTFCVPTFPFFLNKSVNIDSSVCLVVKTIPC